MSRTLVVALALTGLTMRTAVTSVGAALDDLQHGLHTTSLGSGVITTLPVICFAGMGAVAPRVARSVGPHRLLLISLACTTAGLASRALVGTVTWFAVLTVLALIGPAVSNVLLPGLVKQHFPERIGTMTALYTTALAVGATIGAGLTVPIGSTGGGWRLGLGSWAVLSAVAALPWLTTLRDDRPDDAEDVPHTSLRRLLRSRTAWALTLFFGVQSMQAYIAFGWFARFLVAHGLSDARAGAMVAVLTALGIPVSLVAPRFAVERHRPVTAVLCACYLVAYVGLAVSPGGAAAWIWMAFAGIGGGTFPLALALIGLRARTAATTAALSAFVQGIGYVIAGLGPVLFGALHGATQAWTLPLALLFACLIVTTVTAWPSTAPRYVDDELAASLA